MLGTLLVAGTAAGALAVRPGAAYLIIPVPPLAYAIAATLAGLIHDRAADTSLTALAVSAAQWIASGFLAMTTATLLAIAVATARWAGHNGRDPRRPRYAPATARPSTARRAHTSQATPAVRLPGPDGDRVARNARPGA